MKSYNTSNLQDKSNCYKCPYPDVCKIEQIRMNREIWNDIKKSKIDQTLKFAI